MAIGGEGPDLEQKVSLCRLRWGTLDFDQTLHIYAGSLGARLGGASGLPMIVRDTQAGYGIVSRLLHWGMAIAIFALFALGYWMVELDYYSPYYVAAPNLHRGAGILVLFVLVARFAWRLANVKPSDEELTPLERKASHVVHWGFYPLLLALMVSGYLISTPDGRPIDVLGLFSVPSLIQWKGLEDTAGLVHRWLAYLTIGVAILHTLGALKHHFADKSRILTRMWSGPAPSSTMKEDRS